MRREYGMCGAFAVCYIMIALLLPSIAEAGFIQSSNDIYDRLVEEFTYANYAEVIEIYEASLSNRSTLERKDSAKHYSYAKAVVAAFEKNDIAEALRFLEALPDTFYDTVDFRFYIRGRAEEEKGDFGAAVEAYRQANGIFDSVLRIVELADSISMMPAEAAPPQPADPSQTALPLYTEPTPSYPVFEAGKKYEVYSGPGAHYLRGANGKALVSTNDWVAVIGTDNGWLLVQYEVNESAWRRGYILAGALSSGAVSQLPGLPRAGTVATITAQCVVTDDPDRSRAPLMMIDEGAQVEYFYDYGEWAYIEAIIGGTMLRGYIQSRYLQQ